MFYAILFWTFSLLFKKTQKKSIQYVQVEHPYFFLNFSSLLENCLQKSCFVWYWTKQSFASVGIFKETFLRIFLMFSDFFLYENSTSKKLVPLKCWLRGGGWLKHRELFSEEFDFFTCSLRGDVPKKWYYERSAPLRGGGVNTLPLTFTQKVQLFILVKKTRFWCFEVGSRA